MLILRHIIIKIKPDRWFILAFFTWCTTFLAWTQPDFKIKNFTKKEYQAEYQNWAASVGTDNLVYCANNGGLLVYDGISWEFHSRPNITNVRSVKVDTNSGLIYTSGYREMGFWRWDSLGQLEYHSLTPLIEDQFSKNEEFWKIEIISDSVIFQSFSGIFILHNGKFEVIRPDGFVNSMTCINHTIYLHLMNEGIFTLKDGGMKPFVTGPIFNQKMIRFLLPLGKDSLLIGTAEQGVFMYDGEAIQTVFDKHTSYFQANTINRACMINDNTIVIGTILDGIIGMNKNGETLFKINEESGLQNNTVLGLISSGSYLWATLDRGIALIDFQTDPSYEIHEVNEIGAVYSAAVFEGDFYLGTNQGLYRKALNKPDENFTIISGTQGQVWDCSIIENQLFIGHNSGTFVIDGGEIDKISEVSGGFCIIDNPFEQNSLMQSTYSNLVYYRKVNGKWVHVHNLANFFDLIRYIELDHLNNLWAGHMRRAIYKLKLNDKQDSILGINYYGKNSVFGKEYGINVFKVENRIVFTSGEMLYTYDDIHDSIIPYKQLNTRIDAYKKAHRIISAKNHYYWFITSGSVGLFNFGLQDVSLIKEYPLKLFGHHIIEGYENVIPLSNTKAVLCLENGYAILDAGTEKSRSGIQQVNIKPRKVAIYGRSLKEIRMPFDTTYYEIPYSKNNLRLHYAFPYYAIGNIQYKYFIEGLDEQWSDPVDKPDFEFIRLPVGEYTIHVHAENEWGEKSEAHAIHVSVLPPWYFSWIALIFYALIVGCVLVLVRYSAVKRVKQKEKKKTGVKRTRAYKTPKPEPQSRVVVQKPRTGQLNHVYY